MSEQLDLHDIQGNVIKAYVHHGFLNARYVLYTINESAAGRAFVKALAPKVTTAAPWKTPNDAPRSTTDVAFTFEGLKRLGLPQLSLNQFPAEFSMGMQARRDILCDHGPSAPEQWDPIWQTDGGQNVHMLVSINGKNANDVETRYNEIAEMLKQTAGKGVQQLDGHIGDDGKELPYQAGTVLYKDVGGQVRITGTEHFQFADGISNPHFKGCGLPKEDIVGNGKPVRGGDPSNLSGWAPLETGEFILGHKDEAQEYPQAPLPPLLSRNGTFMAYRKLHQNVKTFEDFLTKAGKFYQQANGYETLEEARETLAAKISGRWRRAGSPITNFHTYAESEKFADEFEEVQEAVYSGKADNQIKKRYQQLCLMRTGFNFDDDIDGQWCPTGAHIRRVNPRGSLEFGVKDAYDTPGALTDRRRIARRGLPYGQLPIPPTDDGNHGIIVFAVNASLRRQFEFVQQQWSDFGNDFKLGNDRDPLLGNHSVPGGGGKDGEGRMVINGGKKSNKAPYFLNDIPTFVETRGGEYFFIPSLTALRMIGEGIIDPT